MSEQADWSQFITQSPPKDAHLPAGVAPSTRPPPHPTVSSPTSSNETTPSPEPPVSPRHNDASTKEVKPASTDLASVVMEVKDRQMQPKKRSSRASLEDSESGEQVAVGGGRELRAVGLGLGSLNASINSINRPDFSLMSQDSDHRSVRDKVSGNLLSLYGKLTHSAEKQLEGEIRKNGGIAALRSEQRKEVD